MDISGKIENLNKKLLSENWVTGDFNTGMFSQEQKSLLEDIILHIPEWKRTIGLKQHSFHDYSLDIHILLVLKNLHNSAEYQNLNIDKKLILIYSALLHDIEKNENEVDQMHPVKGAEKSCTILYRLGFEEEFINTVYALIRFHQVLGLIVSERIKFSDDELLKMFKNPDIVDMQAILSAADIKSVKKDGVFYIDDFDEKFAKIKDRIKSLSA